MVQSCCQSIAAPLGKSSTTCMNTKFVWIKAQWSEARYLPAQVARFDWTKGEHVYRLTIYCITYQLHIWSLCVYTGRGPTCDRAAIDVVGIITWHSQWMAMAQCVFSMQMTWDIPVMTHWLWTSTNFISFLGRQTM